MLYVKMGRLLAIVLALAMIASLGVSAFAEGSYAADQRYVQDKEQEEVYAIRVASRTEVEPEALRDELLKAGFDAYLYEKGDKISVLCGKFREFEDALACRDEITKTVKGVKVYLSCAWLPAEVIDAFEAGPSKPEETPAAQSTPAQTKRRTSSWDDTEGTQVYTVALSSSQKAEYAQSICEKMEKAGFDAFIMEENGSYHVMSGKFHDICNALKYRDCIWSNTDRTDTYITEVTVDEEAIRSFTEDYEKNGRPGKIKSNLEKPTGPFYREADGKVCAYVVQFAAGTSFSGAERSRDAMTAAGFPSYVYECSRVYEIMTGAFSSKSDAEAYCQKLKDDTGNTAAYVTRAMLPAGMVK